MIQNYITSLKNDDPSSQETFWDGYLDKQLAHLVLEYSFDFDRIAETLKNIKYKNSENVISREKCQSRWTFLHLSRKKVNDIEEVPEETIEQKFNKLMARKEPPKEPTSPFENKIDEGEKPSGFNIFKDSIRGPKEREISKEKEMNFLRNLDSIQLDDEESKIDKPLLFKAEFLDDKSVCFTKEILSKEKADEILSKKIDWSKLSKEYDATENQEFSKNKVEMQEEEIKTSQVETKEQPVNKFEEEEEIKTNEVIFDEPPKDEVLDRFKKIEEGFFTIEDVVEDLDKLNLDFKTQKKEEKLIQDLKTQDKPKDEFESKKKLVATTLSEKEEKENNKDKSNISNLKQILILQELENVQDTTSKKVNETSNPIKKVSFEGVIEEHQEEMTFGKDSSEESAEDEEDYFENQRLHIKLGSDAKFSETKSENKQRKKKKPKVKTGKKDSSNDNNELPMIEQLIQEKMKSKKQNEENEKSTDVEFVAGEKFRQQLLLEELERRKNTERQKDLEEMKRLQEKFKNEIEENKRKRKEQKKKELEAQAILVQEQKKFIEQQQKKFDEEVKVAFESYKKEKEEDAKSKKIEEAMNEPINKIKSFEMETSIGLIFDQGISLMQPVSSLPEEVFNYFTDHNSYELSRFGITKRFQILIFPYLDDMGFLSEFLGYFLRNSCFETEKNQKDMEKTKANHFAFQLIAIHLSAYTPSISDEESETFCYSNYMLNPHELKRQIEDGNLKRYIYLIFDTYQGEGSQILGDVVLDVSVRKNVLSEKCVQKLAKKNIFDFHEGFTLKQFALKHLKSMKIATKLFHELTTFHPISTKITKSNEVCTKITKNNEVCLVFMKNYRYEPVFSENSSQIPDENQPDIIRNLIKRTFIKGLELVGLKTVYFHRDSYQEFAQTFDKSRFFEPNVAILVFAFSGYEVISKIEKIVGSNDIFLARKHDSKSLNALYFEKKEDTLHYFLNKSLNRKLLAYFFAGRLSNYRKETFEKLLFEPKKEKQFHLFPKTVEYSPLFQIVVQPIQLHFLILSPIFNDMCKVATLIQKLGFKIVAMKTLSKDGLEQMMSKNDEISKEIDGLLNEESLHKFCFLYEEENKFKTNTFLIIEAPKDIHFFKKKLLKSVLLHKKEFYPNKNQLIFDTSDPKTVLIWSRFLQRKIAHHSNLTKCVSIPHFLAFWPLNDYQHDILHILNYLEFLKAQHFELIGLNFNGSAENPQEIETNTNAINFLKEELSNNLQFSKSVKKKAEYIRFLDFLVSFLLENKTMICVFRFQGSEEELNGSQLFEHKLFANSLQKCNEGIIQTLVNKKANNFEEEKEYRKHIFLQNFDIFFAKIELDKLLYLGKELGVELSDDTSVLNSIVTDFDNSKNPESNRNYNKGVIIIQEESMKILSINGVLKRFETENLQLEFVRKVEFKEHQETIDVFWENIKKFMNFSFKKQKESNVLKMEREKNEIMMKFLDCFHKGTSWLFVLQAENPVYKW